MGVEPTTVTLGIRSQGLLILHITVLSLDLISVCPIVSDKTKRKGAFISPPFASSSDRIDFTTVYIKIILRTFV